ncbi:MAG: HAD family hydrolase [Tepidanaerobacter acetatoxydans]|uniref:HAD family hydrolase n=1 Tax=Tepidanaerobacter acetatoxydans TaxID=499229 RepID=UPI0026F0C81F|nr:HAD family hydrolase [Tepidanaerobacter acetatoxydans]NLU10655.1 HAD family hydrolase [Tepidanaerobacter acetatoxydans]
MNLNSILAREIAISLAKNQQGNAILNLISLILRKGNLMRIDTVIFDMGGTIEDIYYDKETRFEATKQILGYLKEVGVDLKLSPEDFFAIVLEGMAKYKQWAEKTFIEAHPTVIWHDWILKDFYIPIEKIARVSEQIAFTWETVGIVRNIRSKAKQTLKELKDRGYKLGIISNTQSFTQVFYSLYRYGIRDFFEYISLSSIEGIRKPDRKIFDKAVKEMNTVSGRAVYIGDTIKKDIIGSKAAGFAIAAQIRSFSTDKNDADIDKEKYKPDYLLTNLIEIVNILDKLNNDN